MRLPRPKTLFGQLLLAQLVLIVLVVTAGETLSERLVLRVSIDQLTGQLEAEARGLAGLWERLGTGSSSDVPEQLRTAISVDKLTRFTVVAPDGRVVADSWHGVEGMENHRERPEFRDALSGVLGSSTRWSDTIGEDLFYVAVPATRGGEVFGAVRAARSVRGFQATLARVRAGLLILGAVLALLAWTISYFIAGRLLKPIEQMKVAARSFAAGEQAKPLDLPEIEELAVLARALNRVAARVQEQFREVTAQRNERETILASMQESVIALDTQRRVVSVNHAASQLFQVEQRAAIGQPLSAIVRNPGVERVLREVLASAKPVWRDISDEIHQQVLQVHGVPLRMVDEDEVRGVLMVIHDVTHLRRLEGVQRDFVANVSHELKTPLTTIRGFVETLLSGAMYRPDDCERFLKIIATHVGRLQELIDNLLSLAALEQAVEDEPAVTKVVQMTEANARELVSRAVDVCAQRISDRAVHVRNEVPEHLRLTVNAPLIEQAIVNLLDNAVKFSNSGDTVTLSAEHGDNQTAFAVTDQGPGIQRHHQGRVFERFYRVEECRARTAGGTGLGLAIVKHIAKIHHGSVFVESSPGQGSTFRLILPDAPLGAQLKSKAANH